MIYHYKPDFNNQTNKAKSYSSFNKKKYVSFEHKKNNLISTYVDAYVVHIMYYILCTTYSTLRTSV